MRHRTAGAVAVIFGFIVLDRVAAQGHDKNAAPCSPDSREHGEATAELSSIDRDIRALAPADDPHPLVARLKGVTNGGCFALLGGFYIEPKSGLSLKTYWEDGGFEHLKSYLDLGKPGSRLLWFPPSIRRALTVETAPASPIAQILCPAVDETCGRAETSGWVLRAENSFELAR